MSRSSKGILKILAASLAHVILFSIMFAIWDAIDHAEVFGQKLMMGFIFVASYMLYLETLVWVGMFKRPD